MKITVTTPRGEYSSGEEPTVDNDIDRTKIERGLLTTFMNGRDLVLKQPSGFTVIPGDLLKQSVIDVEW